MYGVLTAVSLAAVAGLVSISAAVIGFLCDELSENERCKQEELRKEYKRYREQCKACIDDIGRDKREALAALDRKYQKEKDKLYNDHNEYIQKMREELADVYRKILAEREEYQGGLENEIRQVLSHIRNALSAQVTHLRKNALEQLFREMSESLSKAIAYKQYLKLYKRRLEYCLKTGAELPSPVEFSVPKDFLYNGKLLFMEKKDIRDKGEIVLENVGVQPYVFTESDFIDEYADDARIPLMVVFDHDTFQNELSAKKGIFKNTVLHNPRLGINAEVVKYASNKAIELLYSDCIKLRLARSNLENPKRIPFIGAALRVYPIRWKFDLSDNFVDVSERSSDSLLNYTFEDIPVVFSENAWPEFEAALKKNNLLESEDEWKIAPYDERELPNVKKIKLQLGLNFVFAVTVRHNKEYPYFYYDAVLDSHSLIKPDDVFVPMNCTLNCVLEPDIKELTKNVYENMVNLALMIFSEFKLQYQTKLSQYGMQYFNKWTEVNDKLIDYLKKGKSVEADIKYVQKELFPQKHTGLCVYRVYFENVKEIDRFISETAAQMEKKRDIEFFIEISTGVYLPVEFDASCEFMRVFGNEADAFFGIQRTHILIYFKNFSYAEYQQSIALNLFRMGKTANAYLQICALDSANIVREEKEFTPCTLFNETLQWDMPKLEILNRALSEKNIFLIQGPPGTGKTTIICEMVLQYLNQNKLSNILIVSQANVAVDNVLKHFLKSIPDNIIRCGQADKIASNMEKIAFDTKYNLYIDKMEKKYNENPDNILLKRWLDIVNPSFGYNADIGELLMKGHQIIGATCVGLAKKRIGLDRMVFDLVIIDEAGKALPAEILIPYVKAKKVILIGDHKQLPPAINPALFDESKIEIEDRDIYEDELFNISFFQRMYENAPESNKAMLSTQFRMPAPIGTLVSNLFYEGKLSNAEQVRKKKPFYFKSHLNLIDMSCDPSYKEESKKGISVVNRREVEIVSRLIMEIRKKISPGTAKIAVITPYRGQKRLIISSLIDKNIKPADSNIDINTIDAFQGDEAEIVIFCTTRAVKPTSYFSDYRRINVALSRTKNELIIIGSKNYFYKFKDIMPAITDYIQSHGKITPYTKIRGLE